MIDWVVFDLGDVVLQHTTALPRLAGLLSVAPKSFKDAYWNHRREYDLHSHAPTFWTAVTAGSGAPAPDADVIAELVRVDDLGWGVADPVVLRLIDDLKAAGTALAVLSNAPASMGRLIEASPWAGQFDHLLFSGDLGVGKPDPRIYRALLRRIGAEPAQVAFVDDRADNIAGAVAAGIRGLVFTGAETARADLRGLGLPV